jgi:hypothetical protein
LPQQITYLLKLTSKPYECDIKNDASVTSLILSRSSFISTIQNILSGNSKELNNNNIITSMSLAYNTFRLKDGSLATQKDFKTPFQWFCSGSIHKPNKFGDNTGFVDQLYIFGEEAPAEWGNGRFFALHGSTLHLISGVGSGDATKIQGGMNGLMEDALENVAMVDTGESGHVILVCSPDYGSKALKIYVGIKGEKALLLVWM